MKNLVIVGHNDLSTSIANKIIVEQFKDFPDTEIRILSELYPDFKINVEKEQASLVKAQNIVFIFPLQWYSYPAILKHWIDKVFTFGFAYGSGGDKLANKNIYISITTGGSETSYSSSGYNLYPLKDLLKPLEVTFNLAKMNYNKEPFISYSMMGLISSHEQITESAIEQANKIKRKLK